MEKRERENKFRNYPIDSKRKGGAKPKKMEVRRDKTLFWENSGKTIEIPAKYICKIKKIVLGFYSSNAISLYFVPLFYF